MTFHDIVGLVVTSLFLIIVLVQNLRAALQRTKQKQPSQRSEHPQRTENERQWARYVESLYDDEKDISQKVTHPPKHSQPVKSKQWTPRITAPTLSPQIQTPTITSPFASQHVEPKRIPRASGDAYTTLPKQEKVSRGKTILAKLSSVGEMVVVQEIIGKPKGL